MKTTQGQRIKIGLFTTVGILIIIFAVFFIGNQKSLFSSTIKISGLFKNVNGLQLGNNVRFAGINIGVVNDIQIMNDTTVKVVLLINTDVKKFIKKDAKMSIGSDGLMGDKLVVVAPGAGGDNTEINDGDQINSVNPVDVDKIIAKLTKIADNTGTLIDNLSQIVAKINSGKGSIGRLINNDKMAKDLDATVKSAKSTMDNVHKTTTTINQSLSKAQNSFLLKPFFGKKKTKAQRDSIKKVKTDKRDSTKTAKKAARAN
jgi:phospholipid/cholesterol/gamma-HCH transport system substrate-binding protein